ncbi:MAG: hypothetical protein KatS3mg115_0215 [Candidatus Poribacteria bacterium]|nr:MAG: hypothetical protein KatS3mg115_0215 [Candidatus Poribacteria bacterium]
MPVRLAALVTACPSQSFTQGVLDRLLEGYFFGGQYRNPRCRIVSFYLAQPSPGDLVQERSEELGVPIHHTVPAALMAGANALNVDGVLLLAADGQYPQNEYGQRLLPRHDLFRQVCRVFHQSRRSAPVFLTGPLAVEWEKIAWMENEVQKAGFPLFCGSYLPLTWRLPPVHLPENAPILEALVVAFEPSEEQEYHALEALQAILERREGGESGVVEIHHWAEEAFWQAGAEGEWSWELLTAALSRSDTPQGNAVLDGRPEDLVATGAVRQLAQHPYAYGLRYADGVRGTVVVLPGVVRDYLFAAQVGEEVISAQFLLPPPPNTAHLSALVEAIERFFIEGRSPVPPARAALVAGALEACRKLHATGGTTVQTPELAKIAYRPTAEDRFADSEALNPPAP